MGSEADTPKLTPARRDELDLATAQLMTADALELLSAAAALLKRRQDDGVNDGFLSDRAVQVRDRVRGLVDDIVQHRIKVATHPKEDSSNGR